MVNNKEVQNNLWFEEYPLPFYSLMIKEILNFHNKTVLINEKNKVGLTSSDELNWAINNENRENSPNVYIEQYKISNKVHNNFKSSHRKFKDENLSLDEISFILNASFGNSNIGSGKRYPSAGALYPIVPILFLFHEITDDKIKLPAGVYMYDGKASELFLLKAITDANIDEYIQSFDYNFEKKLPSNYCIGYSFNIKKAVSKYKHRGYRHGLIEVGTLVQSLREVINQVDGLGEFCSSAYDDFSVTWLSELNVREAPIVLLQWFGKIRE